MNLLEYYFCDHCKLPSNSPECPNCFQPARKLDQEHECIECGHKLGECTCVYELPNCPKCGGSHVHEDGYYDCLYCEDCGEYFNDD